MVYLIDWEREMFVFDKGFKHRSWLDRPTSPDACSPLEQPQDQVVSEFPNSPVLTVSFKEVEIEAKLALLSLIMH